ncbi:hypothetical protein MES5069_680082 [Mesorhizobium escarrei]|uniref:Uncharacterized protein n=1 Tax=Mesorhizobium escarrei TaxID=666018 RepID=A0ABM9EG92_9HYPH|nr:hypothetical protein MES5069_680082 [Mesorhizobium escarrei]
MRTEILHRTNGVKGARIVLTVVLYLGRDHRQST